MNILLINLLFLLPAFLTGPRVIVEDSLSISSLTVEKAIFSQQADSSELPPLHLLQTALAGYEMLVKDNLISCPEVITIIDFSLPSDKERLWVLDLIHGKVLFRCLVSHGRNSGELMAENFSNNPGSCASSPGFYLLVKPI